MKKKFFILAVFIVNFAYSQIGGRYTYLFANTYTNARYNALASSQITSTDDDFSLTEINPALLGRNMKSEISLNYANRFAGINDVYTSFAVENKKIGTLAIGIRSVNYGNFQERLENEEKLGNFTANDLALNFIWSKIITKDSSFTAGVNFKPIFSFYEKYSSYGFLTDFAVNYKNDKNLFSVAFLIKNIGTQFKTYNSGGDFEKIPFELQIGAYKKLRHAPFAFSLLAHNLERFQINHKSLQNSNFKEVDEKDMKFQEKLINHFSTGLEFIPLKILTIRLGYNFSRRYDMRIESKPGTTGISWGFSINAKKYTISYTRATNHLHGAMNFVSIGFNLKKKTMVL